MDTGALENIISLEDNARSAVGTTRGGNSYLVVSRWSQNDEGFLKSGNSKRCDRRKDSRRGDRKRSWSTGRNSAIVTVGYITVPDIRVIKVIQGPDPVGVESSAAVMVETDHRQWILKRRGGVMGRGNGPMTGNMVIIDMVSEVDLVTEVS